MIFDKINILNNLNHLMMNKVNFNNKQNNRIILYGKHVVVAALNNPNRIVHRVFVSKNSYKFLNTLPEDIAIKIANKIEIIDSRKFNQLLPDNSLHQNIALDTEVIQKKIKDFTDQLSLAESGCIILLDQITDPHNVGSILRSSLAFGIKMVISTIDQAVGETAILAKAAAGALESVNFIKITNLINTINLLKESGFWVVGLDSHAKQLITNFSLPKKTAFILGSEGKGMRKLTKENCDVLIKLPINSAIESLNVSNAAAIAVYEFSKQTTN